MTAAADERAAADEAAERLTRLAATALAGMAVVVLLAAAGSGSFGGDYPAAPIIVVTALTGVFGIIASEAIGRTTDGEDAVAVRVGIVCTAAILAFVGAFVAGEAAVYPVGASVSAVGLMLMGRGA